MPVKNTKWKGPLGATKAIARFAELGIPAFQAVATEHLPYDFIVDDGAGLRKVQAKYREAGPDRVVQVPSSNSWSNARGTHSRLYTPKDFDILTVYVPEVDKVLFLPFEMCGKSISLERRIVCDYYWWEDFLAYPPAIPSKREKEPSPKARWLQAQRVGVPDKRAEVAALPFNAAAPRGRKCKIAWPPPAVLAQLVATRPAESVAKELGVSGAAVRKRCLAWGIPLKPRGYWAQVAAGKVHQAESVP